MSSTFKCLLFSRIAKVKRQKTPIYLTAANAPAAEKFPPWTKARNSKWGLCITSVSVLKCLSCVCFPLLLPSVGGLGPAKLLLETFFSSLHVKWRNKLISNVGPFIPLHRRGLTRPNQLNPAQPLGVAAPLISTVFTSKSASYFARIVLTVFYI